MLHLGFIKCRATYIYKRKTNLKTLFAFIITLLLSLSLYSQNKESKQNLAAMSNTSKTLNKLDSKMLPEAYKKNIELLSSLTESLGLTSDLKKQRLYFKSLSKIIIDMVSKSKNLNETVYIQFCPMADQNKGAKWLSLEKKIMNPYFGDKMLNCGSVLEEIK